MVLPEVWEQKYVAFADDSRRRTRGLRAADLCSVVVRSLFESEEIEVMDVLCLTSYTPFQEKNGVGQYTVEVVIRGWDLVRDGQWEPDMSTSVHQLI